MKTFSITIQAESGTDLIAAAIFAADAIQNGELELDAMPIDAAYDLCGDERVMLQRHD